MIQTSIIKKIDRESAYLRSQPICKLAHKRVPTIQAKHIEIYPRKQQSMVNQQSSLPQQLQHHQPNTISTFDTNSLITTQLYSSVQQKFQNLFDQPTPFPEKLQKSQQQSNDQWDDLAFEKYQSKSNNELNDSQIFKIFAPCNKENTHLIPNNYPTQPISQQPLAFGLFESLPNIQQIQNISAKSNQTNVKSYKQDNQQQQQQQQVSSPYTPQKSNQQCNVSNNKCQHSNTSTTTISSAKEEVDVLNYSMSLHNLDIMNDFLSVLCDSNSKQQACSNNPSLQFSSSYKMISESRNSSSKSSNCNSDTEETCCASTHNSSSSTYSSSSEIKKKKNTRKVIINHSLEQIWNRPYDGFFENNMMTI